MNQKRFITLSFSYSVALVISILVYVTHFWFHELGHISLGFISNFIIGNVPQGLHLVEWHSLAYIPYPTKTKFDLIINNPLYSLGGPLFTIIYGLIIYLSLNYMMKKYKLKNKIVKILILIIFIFYLIEGIIGNFTFGTDNWTGRAIINWSNFPIIDYIYGYHGLILIIMLTLCICYVIQPYLKSFRKFLRKAY